MDRTLALTGVLLAHLAVAAVHGLSHGLLAVGLAPWQNAVVLLAVFLGPVIGVALVRREHPLGLPLFTASMAVGLLFGLAFHFLLENPDHIHALPAGTWRLPFQATAVGLVVTGGAGTGLGGWYWWGR
ncbi:hypothetical protein [Haloglomus halophilum]|uniref:hypothetical protein n=1 Tax=Haloglomus halophilum TaxID=2962672 RepID=UPI0020C94B01|nr:hypothetical protein [Haloglomus halophilum]